MESRKITLSDNSIKYIYTVNENLSDQRMCIRGAENETLTPYFVNITYDPKNKVFWATDVVVIDEFTKVSVYLPLNEDVLPRGIVYTDVIDDIFVAYFKDNKEFTTGYKGFFDHISQSIKAIYGMKKQEKINECLSFTINRKPKKNK